jgi:hypothetical protein
MQLKTGAVGIDAINATRATSSGNKITRVLDPFQKSDFAPTNVLDPPATHADESQPSAKKWI